MLRESKLAKCAVRALAATLVAVVFGLLDPLGLDEAADHHSADVISRMTAPFYGYPDYRGRRRVAVIEISDHTLNTYGLGWPAPRFLYAGLIRLLVPEDAKEPGDELETQRADAARPAAIFLDFALVSNASSEDRESLSEVIRRVTAFPQWGGDLGCHRSALAKIACIVDHGGVPIILGKGYPPNACLTETSRRASADDVALAQMAVVVPLGWPDLPTRFQPVFTRQAYIDELDRALRPGAADRNNGENLPQASEGETLAATCDDLTPVVPGLIEGATADGEQPTGIWAPLGFKKGDARFGYDLAPATAMFYALCRRDGSSDSLCVRLNGAKDTDHFPDFGIRRPAGPEWGSVSDPETAFARRLVYGDAATVAAEACADEKPTPGRVLRVGWAQLTSGLGRGAAATAVNCPYHLTLDADAFLRISNEKAAELRAFFKDRAVSIGAAQTLSNDWISTTLNARQPGVHYHAMALDNLLEDGAALRRQPDPVFPENSVIGGLGLDWGEVLEFACLLLIAFLIELVRQRVKSTPAYAPKVWKAPLGRGGVRRTMVALHSRARRNWRNGQDERHRIAWVAGALLASTVVMTLAVAATAIARWEPVNVVGILGFTLVLTAVELWDLEGWTAIGSLVLSVAVMAPARITAWFRAPPIPMRRTKADSRATQPLPGPSDQPPLKTDDDP